MPSWFNTLVILGEVYLRLDLKYICFVFSSNLVFLISLLLVTVPSSVLMGEYSSIYLYMLTYLYHKTSK